MEDLASWVPMSRSANAPSSKPGRVLAVVCATAFFGVLNASAVTVILPEMGQTYAVEPGPLGWVMSIFLLTYGVAIPVYGRLSDRFGARRLYLMGMGLFGGGSLACALAPDLGSMLGARVIQALGGAAFPGLGMTLASRAFPPQQRGVALGSIAATMGVGSAIGPLAGGLIADLMSWRLLFGISGMAVLIIPVGRAVLPREADLSDEPLDLLGGGLLALGISGALFALAEGSRAGWTQPWVVGAVVVAIGALVVAALHHRRAPVPFLPRELVAMGAFRRVVSMGFLTSASNLAALIGFPLLLTHENGLSPFDIGLVLVPGAIATAVMGVIAGRLADRHGARLPTFVGASLMVIVMLGLSQYAGRSVLAVGIFAGILGAGFALINTPLATAISTLVRPKVLASGLSLNIMVFFVGGSFGTTLLVSVAEAGLTSAWNPLYSGTAVGFSNAFLVFAVPTAITATLALGLPRRTASPAATPVNQPSPSPAS